MTTVVKDEIPTELPVETPTVPDLSTYDDDDNLVHPVDGEKSLMQQAFIGRMLKEAMDGTQALTPEKRERLLMAFNLACMTVMEEQKVGIQMSAKQDPFDKLYPVRQEYAGHCEAVMTTTKGISVKTPNSVCFFFSLFFLLRLPRRKLRIR